MNKRIYRLRLQLVGIPSSGGLGHRFVFRNSLVGPLQTELGNLDLTWLCVRRPSRKQTDVWEINKQVEGRWKKKN